MSSFSNAISYGDGNWDWDSYIDINGEEVYDDEGIDVKVIIEGGDEDNNGDFWVWGSDSDSLK